MPHDDPVPVRSPAGEALPADETSSVGNTPLATVSRSSDTAERAAVPTVTSGVSFFSAVNIVIASMIGAGVYTTSGFALADLGSPWLVLLAWGVGGLLAICGAISYGALAERFTESGGEYLFLSRALHPAAGNVAGFVSLLAGFTGAIAFAASTFEAYADGLFGLYLSEWTNRGWVASSLVATAAVVHGFRLRVGTRVQDSLVVLKLAMLTAFLLFALFSLRQPWQGATTAKSGWADLSVVTFAVSLMWISLSYSGFNAAIYITGEARGSGPMVRRALLCGTLVVTLIYLFLNGVFVFAPPADAVIGKHDIAAEAARAIGGNAFAAAFRVAILVSLATSVLSLMMTGPRVYAKMADDGVLPKFFRFDTEVPRAGIFVQAIFAIVVIRLASLQQLLSYLGMTLSLSAALTVASLFVLRRRGEVIDLPLYPLPPLVFLGGTLVIAVVAGIEKPIELAFAVATLIVGLIAAPFSRRHSSSSGAGTNR